MTAKKTKAKAEPVKAPFIVYGSDESGKPKAGRFAHTQFELASQAAVSMDLGIYEALTADVLELAKKLPAGRIYARGKAFIPYIRRDLYDKLCELAGTPMKNNAAQRGSKDRNNSEPPVPPRTWDEIAAGHTVLVQESRQDGWWECVVVSRLEDMLTLRWRDYASHPPFPLHIASVALINPGPPSNPQT